MIKWIKRMLPHLTIVLAFMVITFFVIDRINRSMAFMTSEMSKWLFFIFAILVLPVAIMAIGEQWREDARQARRELKQQAREQALSDKLFYHHQAVDEPESLEPAEEEEDTISEETADEEAADPDANPVDTPSDTEEE